MQDTTPNPPPIPSADELKRLHADTRALLTAAMQDAATRLRESLAPAPASQDERALLLDRLKQDVQDALAAIAAGGPRAARDHSRFACDTLRLWRACARATCRKAQCCRGDAVSCYAHAKVPEPAREWADLLLTAELMPWLPFIAPSHAAQRTAYECWIAGLEARVRVR